MQIGIIKDLIIVGTLIRPDSVVLQLIDDIGHKLGAAIEPRVGNIVTELLKTCCLINDVCASILILSDSLKYPSVEALGLESADAHTTYYEE